VFPVPSTLTLLGFDPALTGGSVTHLSDSSGAG